MTKLCEQTFFDRAGISGKSIFAEAETAHSRLRTQDERGADENVPAVAVTN